MEIILLPGFNLSRQEVTDIATKSLTTQEPLDLCIPIAGQLYFTDSYELAMQFYRVAHIGEQLSAVCTQIDSYLPASINDHDNAGFELIPRDVNAFVDKLWSVIIPFMAEELRNQEDIDDLSVFEAGVRLEDWIEYLPASVSFPEVIQFAEEIMKVANVDGGDENE